MMEYSIVVGYHSPVDFRDAVNRAIKHGWTPQGGVCCVTNMDGNVTGWVQAMVRTRRPVRLEQRGILTKVTVPDEATL